MIRKDSAAWASVDLYSALIDKAAGKSDESMTETAVIEQEPAFIWVGEGDGRRRIARARPRRRLARADLARWVQFRHERYQGAGAGCVGRRAWPRLRPVRLFRPR